MAEQHDDYCPTCGRYVPGAESGEGYYDLPPGGFQSVDYLVVYCDEGCANRKPQRAYYEDDPDYDAAWEAY